MIKIALTNKIMLYPFLHQSNSALQIPQANI